MLLSKHRWAFSKWQVNVLCNLDMLTIQVYEKKNKDVNSEPAAEEAKTEEEKK